MITCSIPVLCVCGLEEKMIKDQKEQSGGFYSLSVQVYYVILLNLSVILLNWLGS